MTATGSGPIGAAALLNCARRVSSSLNVRPRSGATPNSGKKSWLTCAVMTTSASASVLSVRPML